MESSGREVMLESSLKYDLVGPGGLEETSQADGQAILTRQDLELRPRWGNALLFSLRDIDRVNEADYSIQLVFSSGETLTLYHLGRRYNDFIRILAGLRKEILLKDLLMEEKLIKSGFSCRYTRVRAQGPEESGTCEISLWETALVLAEDSGEIERIPYGFINAVVDQDHSLKLEIEDDGHLRLSHLGRRLDLLRGTLSETMNDLSLKLQQSLRELLPGVEESAIRRVSHILKDGRAARRSELERVHQGIWCQLEKEIEEAGIWGKYAYLSTLADPDQMAMGLKRGLMGDLGGTYIWFLVPIWSPDPSLPGNVLVMEAVSGAGNRRATYCFRMLGRQEYRDLEGNSEILRERVQRFIRQLNRSLVAINFRREPIYVPQNQLSEPRFSRYRIPIKKIPELGFLRSRFIGRVLYSSPEEWQRNLKDLLAFNVSVSDDSARWREAETHGEEEE